MKASDLLTELPITVEPTAWIDEARKTMKRCRIRHMPVVQDDRIVGLVSDRDILITLGESRQAAYKPGPSASGQADVFARVDQVMSSPAHCVGPDAHLDHVVEIMEEHKISALPVTGDEGLLGVITKTDLMRWYAEFCAEKPADALATVSVADCMHTEVVTVEHDDAVRLVVDAMAGAQVQHLPVLKNGKLAGIISDRNLRQSFGITMRGFDRTKEPPRRRENDVKAAEIMTPDPKTAHPDDRVADAAAIMLAGRFSALPVVAGGGDLAGIITVTDVVHLIRSLAPAPAA